jgi:rhodanese-related sulfurtransferase
MIDTKVIGYAGDITPSETWKILEHDHNSILIDVRTAAEWAYVGIADLSKINKEVYRIEWKTYPNMSINSNFVKQVCKICINPKFKIFSLCRSGQRSIETSRILTNAGYKECYNVLDGFEGDKNDNNHRGKNGGWKFEGLPWKQN